MTATEDFCSKVHYVQRNVQYRHKITREENKVVQLKCAQIKIYIDCVN